MTPQALLENLSFLSNEDTVSFLNENSGKIKFLFLKEANNVEVDKIFQNILSTLSQKALTDKIKNTDEMQYLYTNLAFYFKKKNQRQFVDTCVANLKESIFTKRLSAWLHHRRYHKRSSHISEFENYLSKLSEAIIDGEDDYTYDILNDLHEYKTSILQLPPDIKREILQKFESANLRAQYPVLDQLKQEELSQLPNLKVANYLGKEYVPSIFAESLFKEKYHDYVKQNELFGYNISEATENIIKKGQADFDKGYRQLTASDVVKIYCYCNMRMHYFSSLCLYERSKLILNFYKAEGKIKFIDIGCGPATSGLAFIEYIYEATQEPAVFDYYGIDNAIAMQQQAADMMRNNRFPINNKVQFAECVSQLDIKIIGEGAACIIINACYVFASNSLPIDKIAKFIEELQKNNPFTPKYLFFQNSVKDTVNERYEQFKRILLKYEIIFTEKQKISYYNQRTKYMAKEIPVFFEILKL